MAVNRKALAAVAVVTAAAVAGGAFAYRRHVREADAAKAEELQKAAADRQALERKCVGVRYRLSQRQTIDLKGRTADKAFIEANCEPARL